MSKYVFRLLNTIILNNILLICFFSGPRLFLSCPMDVEGSRVWFMDLWNYSLVPYILEAVREGLQVLKFIYRFKNIINLSTGKDTKHQ